MVPRGRPDHRPEEVRPLDSLPKRRLGATELWVTPLCIGASPLGSVPDLYGYVVDDEQAVATVTAALTGPINFIDTSNGYGHDGKSERRIGEAIRRLGGLPDSFVLATKVDPDPENGDFSATRVRRSAEESMERLGLDHLQLLYLHDPERVGFAEATGPDGAVEGLVALRDEGVVDHLGVAGGPLGLLRRYMATGLFAVVLSHNRFTLIDRTAEPLMTDARERGMGFVNAAPYGGGMLAKGPQRQPTYGYKIDDDAVRKTVNRLEQACVRHDVPLAAAALQFSTRDERVEATVLGVTSPERIRQTVELFHLPIPPDLWDEIELIVAAAGQLTDKLP